MVCSDVHLQVGLLVGTVVAVGAGEGPLSSVDPHVPCQKGRKVEPLPADGALVAATGGGELASGRSWRGGQVERGLWEATPSEGRKCAVSGLQMTTHKRPASLLDMCPVLSSLWKTNSWQDETHNQGIVVACCK